MLHYPLENMQRQTLYCLTLALSCLFQISKAQNVLFIGNSYTYYHDLPNLLQGLAESAGKDFFQDSHTEGGWTLKLVSPETILRRIGGRFIKLSCYTRNEKRLENNVVLLNR